MIIFFWIFIVSTSRVIRILGNGNRLRNLQPSNRFISLCKKKFRANEESNNDKTKGTESMVVEGVGPLYKNLKEIRLLNKKVGEDRVLISINNEKFLTYLRFNIRCILKPERKNEKKYFENSYFENFFFKIAHPTHLFGKKDLNFNNPSTKKLFRSQRCINLKPKILIKMLNTFFRKIESNSLNISNKNVYGFFKVKENAGSINCKNIFSNIENNLKQKESSDSLKWAIFFQDSQLEELLIFYLLLIKYSNEIDSIGIDDFLWMKNLNLEAVKSKIKEIRNVYFSYFYFTELLDLNFYDYDYFFDKSSEFYEESLKILNKNLLAIKTKQLETEKNLFFSENTFNEVFKKKIYDYKIPLDFQTCIRIKKETTDILTERLFLKVQIVEMIMKLYDTLFLVFSYQRTQIDYVIVANFIIFFAKDIAKLFENEKDELRIYLTMICNLRNFSSSCVELGSYSDKPVKTYVNLSVIAMFSQLKIEDQNDVVIVTLKNKILENFFIRFLYSQSYWLNNILRFYGIENNFFYEFKFIEHLLCRHYDIYSLKGENYYFRLLKYLLDNNIFISDIFDRDELLYVVRSLRSNNVFGYNSEECSELIRIIEYFLKV